MEFGHWVELLFSALGPWKKMLWCAHKGDDTAFFQACLEQLKRHVQMELDAFATNNPSQSALEHQHAVRCVNELVSLQDTDPTFMLGRLHLNESTHAYAQETANYIRWIGHRIACVVYVARRPITIAGTRFVPPPYSLPVHQPIGDLGL